MYEFIYKGEFTLTFQIFFINISVMITRALDISLTSASMKILLMLFMFFPCRCIHLVLHYKALYTMKFGTLQTNENVFNGSLIQIRTLHKNIKCLYECSHYYVSLYECFRFSKASWDIRLLQKPNTQM